MTPALRVALIVGLALTAFGVPCLPHASGNETAPPERGVSGPITGGVEPSTRSKDREVGEQTTEKIPVPKTCEDIRAGTHGSISEQAAETDCEASRHLGAGTGVSSGTGSGKMGLEKGPR